MSSNNVKDISIVNVEGILANFFLEKLEMDDVHSDDNSIGKRKKKHKKYKTKKSRNKHKRRSHSSEKSVRDSTVHSSSEEKDIERLKRLKKLDSKDKSNSALSISNLSSVHTNTDKDSDINVNTVNIPYGPSLETLLGIESKNCDDSINLDTKTCNPVESQIHNNESEKYTLNPEEKETFHSLSVQNESNHSKAVFTDKNIVVNPKEARDFINTKNTVSKVDADLSDSENKLTNKIQYSRSRSSSDNEKKHSKKRSNKSEKYNQSRSPFKHKSHRSRKRSLSKTLSRSRSSSLSKRSKRSRSRSKEFWKKRRGDSDKKRNHSYSRSGHRSRSRSSSKERFSSRSRRRQRNRSRSLSHEYSYSKHYPREDFKYSSKSRKSKDSSSDSDTKSRRRSRSKSHDRHRHYSKNLKIDQAKIRELAQKNVLSMIEKGTLPEGLSLENFKKEQLVSLKAGGKSVQELTDFCVKLSRKENDPFVDENEDNGNENISEESGFIHHPFKLKESSAIKLNIKNAVQIPVKTHTEKFVETARLSSQFPVSSGNQHKQKELEWIPVEPTSKNAKDSSSTKALVPSVSVTTVLPKDNVDTMPNTNESKSAPSVVPSAIALPPTEPTSLPLAPPPLPPVPPPLPPPLPPSNLLPTLDSPVTATSQPCLKSIDYPINVVNSYSFPTVCSYPIVSEMSSFQSPTQFSCTDSVISTVHTSVSQSPSVFSTSVTSNFHSKKPVDISAIVAQRFKALTKLQSNPNDAEALQTLEEAQASIQEWVQSQQVPGLFTGSTGAKLLSVEELSGPRHWNYRAKKDIFTRAAPVTEGKGMSLLKKMGWNPGEGLGKNKEGSLEPLVLDIKTDKKGLVSEGEGSKKLVSSVLKDLQGKHPVSALMELCSKRKWKPPLYTLVKESGPPHKKLFLFKVEVNNVEYQPVTPVNNKKVAKADAAVICLQALNVFPK